MEGVRNKAINESIKIRLLAPFLFSSSVPIVRVNVDAAFRRSDTDDARLLGTSILLLLLQPGRPPRWFNIGMNWATTYSERCFVDQSLIRIRLDDWLSHHTTKSLGWTFLSISQIAAQDEIYDQIYHHFHLILATPQGGWEKVQTAQINIAGHLSVHFWLAPHIFYYFFLQENLCKIEF